MSSPNCGHQNQDPEKRRQGRRWRRKAWRGLPRDPVVRAALIVFLVAAVGLGGSFCYFYIKYDRIIEQRFRSPVFSNSAKIYALPRTVRDGDKMTAKEIAAFLRRAGYSDKDGQSPLGTFHLVRGGIEITPGPESYHSPEEAHISIQDGQVAADHQQGQGAFRVRVGASTSDCVIRLRAAFETPGGEVRPNSEGDGGCRARHRRPAILRAQRREFYPHVRSGLGRSRCGSGTTRAVRP